jgi:hypothetical protein
MHPLALLTLASIAVASTNGCAEPDPYDSPTQVEELRPNPDEPPLAARRTEVDHRDLTLPAARVLELTRYARSHRVGFVLSDAARMTVRTQADADGADVDTVLALARLDERGGRRTLARNDDVPPSRFSALTRDLEAGRYEIVVRGFSARTLGSFVLEASCEGPGCATATACIFGEQFTDLRSSNRIHVRSEGWVRDTGDLPSELASAQLVLAVRESSHDDVTTSEQALSRVDQHEVRRMEVLDEPTGRTFEVYEYGVGDNSYGAIFASGTTTIVASIHDGDLLRCSL